MKEEQLVDMLEARGWRLLTELDSNWVIFKQGSRLMAGRSIHTIIARMKDWDATQELQGKRQEETD